MREHMMEKICMIEWLVSCKIFRLRDYLRKKGKSSHVLMFHDVFLKDNEPKEGIYSISTEELETIIIWHNNRGYRFISLDDMLNEHSLPLKRCIFTFDDGKNSIELALPILHKYRIPYCIYVITSRVGEEGYLTKQQIKILSKDPLCTIGSHTHTHPYTRYLSKSQLIEELIKSKKCLEDIVEKEIFHFAFPYGTVLSSSYFDSNYVRQAGYKSAAYTKQIPLSTRKSQPYHIPRFDASRKNLLKVL